jgi:viologen exporter family transport system permease protein
VSAVSSAGLARTSRARALIDFYLTLMRTAIQAQFQYRVANYMYMIGMVAEPVIYLVVWSTIAEQHGGSVEGITAGQFAAYYIVWTLVRNMNIVFTPYGWEDRIREGQLSAQLLRPLHPIHYDVAFFAGWKLVVIVMWLPIAAALSLIFHPELDVSALEVAVFAVAIWGAYLIRTMFLWLLGMTSIWTTRASALFETYIMAELLLSGRLVPLQLMPDWAQTLADLLPFQWTFFFPIQALVGELSTEELLQGLGMQALWTAIGTGLVVVAFRRSVRHYSAVGN